MMTPKDPPDAPVVEESRSFEPFRFLDLPIELRLMVYEYMPNRTRRTKFIRTEHDVRMSAFTLIITTTSTSILRTCRLIKEEAEKTLLKTANHYLRLTTLEGPAIRVEADILALQAFRKADDFFRLLSLAYKRMRDRHQSHCEVPVLTSPERNSIASLIEQGYLLENGTTVESTHELTRFFQKSVQALLYRNSHHVATTGVGPTNAHSTAMARPIRGVHIALRRSRDDKLSEIRRNLATLVFNIYHSGYVSKVNIDLHVLGKGNKTTQRRDHWQHAVAHSMSRFLRAVFPQRQSLLSQYITQSTTAPFEKEESDIYDRLWRDCEWF